MKGYIQVSIDQPILKNILAWYMKLPHYYYYYCVDIIISVHGAKAFTLTIQDWYEFVGLLLSASLWPLQS